MADEGPFIERLEKSVPMPTLLGLFGGASIIGLFLGYITYYCHVKRVEARRLSGKLNASANLSSMSGVGGLGSGRKRSPDQPLAFHTHRKPTAVKSPSGGNPTHYLKKSPSPTGNSKSPPGMSVPVTPSPTGSQGCHPSDGLEPNNMLPTSVYTTENEVCPSGNTVQTPSKEEMETNEKNLLENSSDLPGYLGQLVFKLRYKHEKNALVVSVVKCKNLPAKDPNLGSSDPYVKLQLLPDKQHKVKTRVLRKTRNPVYDEDFTFYGLNFNQLPSITLHFVVLSFDRYSRDDIIGEVFCAMAGIDLNQMENQQIALSRDIQPRSLKIRSQGRGELLVSLCFQPAANRLTVVVLKARNLPKMDVTGLADPYVKMYLLYNGQRIAKKKTHVKKRTLNPVFNESFVFDIPATASSAAVAATAATATNGQNGQAHSPASCNGLENVSLEFLLLDWDRVTKNEVIGRLELGGTKSTGSALNHWNEVCNSPRRQIADWHKLRE